MGEGVVPTLNSFRNCVARKDPSPNPLPAKARGEGFSTTAVIICGLILAPMGGTPALRER